MPTANRKAHVYKTVATPVGALTLVGSDRGLAAILWENDKPGRVRLSLTARDDNHPVLLETQRQLGEYFAGQRQRFSVKLDFTGTDFTDGMFYFRKIFEENFIRFLNHIHCI